MPELIFGKYEMLERLAVGGMGEVFLARQVSGVSGFERLAILKNLLPDLAADPVWVEQFLDEARVAATLNHPNVVSVYEVGASGGVYYIAMEYIPGANISQLHRKAREAHRPIPPPLAVRIVCESALGLHHAHQATDLRGAALKLVHRDISPQNIMVRKDGVTKVVDFGIARATNRASRTATGAVKGKLAYMAPEQMTAGNVDARADEYALGVVFWELLTGVPLFRGPNDAETIQRVLKAVVAAPSSLVPGLDPALDALVLKMLQRNPEHRFSDCAEVARQLEAWLREAQGPTDSAGLARYLEELQVVSPVDLTPLVPSDFVVKLKSESLSVVTATPHPSAVELSGTVPSRPSSMRSGPSWALLALVAVVLGGGAFGTWRYLQTPEVVAPSAPPAAAAVVEKPAPRAALSIGTNPPGANVIVDGKPRGATPLTLPDLPAGARPKLALELTGYQPVPDVPMEPLGEGEQRQLFIPLTRRPQSKTAPPAPPQPPPAPDGPALLSVRSDPPDAVVYLDGERIGTTTMLKHQVTSGSHQLEVVHPNGRRLRKTITLSPGQLLPLDLKL